MLKIILIFLLFFLMALYAIKVYLKDLLYEGQIRESHAKLMGYDVFFTKKGEGIIIDMIMNEEEILYEANKDYYHKITPNVVDEILAIIEKHFEAEVSEE